jgi:hypothetical protein
VIETVATVRLPRPATHGFDETSWLRHRGIHVVLHADRWRRIGRRGGLGGIADRLRAGLAHSIAPGLDGERRGMVEGVVLGDEQSLPRGLRDDFRASGLYHLLSVAQVSIEAVAPRRVPGANNSTESRVPQKAGEAVRSSGPMEARARKGSHVDGLHEQASSPGNEAVQDAREGLRRTAIRERDARRKTVDGRASFGASPGLPCREDVPCPAALGVGRS